jgi:hypothetical protein
MSENGSMVISEKNVLPLKELVEENRSACAGSPGIFDCVLADGEDLSRNW